MGNALSGVEDLGADIDAAFFSLHAGVPQVGAMDEGDDPKYAPIGGGETGTGMGTCLSTRQTASNHHIALNRCMRPKKCASQILNPSW